MKSDAISIVEAAYDCESEPRGWPAPFATVRSMGEDARARYPSGRRPQAVLQEGKHTVERVTAPVVNGRPGRPKREGM